MSTQFGNAQEALDYVRAMLGLEEDVTFEKIETEPVGAFGSDILLAKAEEPDASESDKAMATSIKDNMAAQETFRPMRDGVEYEFPLKPREGEVAPGESPGTVKIHFTISPFRSGVDCWVTDTRTGMSQRL